MPDKSDIKGLWNILSDNITIKIPKIQRDYAQGREENLDKLENFLDYLKEYLVKEKGKAVLDFVYGAEKEEFNKDTNKQEATMLPLDGQQRLTTLFLLHVYAMKRNCEATEENKNILKRFTYDTRNTAAKFCRALIDNDFEIVSPEDRNKDTEVQQKKLSDVIKEQTWYFSSFDDDQTIKAMINALDKIDEKFYKDSDFLWKKLTEQEKIAFHYLNLKDYKLTDDLYIKMNARGKALTNFENLKAELTDWIKREKQNPENKDNHEFLDNIEKFNNKIDNEWSNFLWKLKGGADNKEYLVDTAFMRIFANCVIFNSSNKYAIKELNENEQQQNMIKYFMYPNYSSRSKDCLEIDKEYSINIFNDFCRILKCYCDLKYDFKDFKNDINFTFWGAEPKETFIKDFIIGNPDETNQKNSSYQEKALFYAHTLYLDIRKSPENKKDDYYKWIRVTRNIAYSKEISGIDSPQIAFAYKYHEAKEVKDVYSAIRYLSNLLKEDNFKEALSKFEINSAEKIKSSSITETVEEEIEKTKIINNDKSYKEIFEQLEDNYLLQGSVKFALDCLKTNLKNSIDKDKLKKLADFFDDNFGQEKTYENREKENNDSFKRALFALLENDEWKYIRQGRMPQHYRYQFFGNLQNIFYIINVAKDNTIKIREKLKTLIYDCCFGKTSYDEIIENYKQNPPEAWKYAIIKNKDGILNREESRDIYIIENKDNEGVYELLTDDKYPNKEHIKPL